MSASNNPSTSEMGGASPKPALQWVLDGSQLQVTNDHYSIEFDLDHGAAIRTWDIGPQLVSAIADDRAELFDLRILSDRDPRPLGTGNIGARAPHSWTTVDVRAEEAEAALNVGIQLASDLDHLHAAVWVELRFDAGETWTCALRSEGMGRTMEGVLGLPFMRAIAFEGDAGRTGRLALGRLPIRPDEGHLPVSALDGRIGIYSTFEPSGALPQCFIDREGDISIRVALKQVAFALFPTPAASIVDSLYPASPGAWTTEIISLEVSVRPGRWTDIFDDHRRATYKQLRKDEYVRPERRWYREAFSQLFANVHSQEVYDPSKGAWTLDAYIEDARARFGGVDTLVLWTSYPNLGIDERSQFDLVDDLPGGRRAIRDLFDSARDGGTRPFIAYLPWHNADPNLDDAAEAARLVGDTGADGLFLDSMWAVHPRFREELDKAGLSSVVFMTEYRPQVSPRMEALSSITGSWAQNFPKVMPSLDLLRFEVPEHKVFVVDRNARERRSLTSVAFFSGNGVVLWDRNFGAPGFMHEDANLYSVEDEEFTRRCYAIWRSHLDVFTSSDCEPLVETLDPDLFANAFRDRGKVLYTIYNAASAAYDGPILRLGSESLNRLFGPTPRALEVSDVWKGAPTQADRSGDGVTISGLIGGQELGCIVLTKEDE